MFGVLGHAVRVWQSKRHELAKEKTRSTKWPTVRDRYLSQHRTCEACGEDANMQVHHKEPFHLRPELELDPGNLIALCMGPLECHLTIGHGDSFKTYNPRVVMHVALAAGKIIERDKINAMARAARET